MIVAWEWPTKKRFFSFAMLIQLLVFSSYSQTIKNLDVNLDIPTFLSLTFSSPTIDFGAITILSGGSRSGIWNIRSNLRSWMVQAYALKGSLTPVINGVYDETGTRIPYYLSFNTIDPTYSFSSSSPLPTTSALALTATFTRKTLNGKEGEDFTFLINIPPAPNNQDWDAGNYNDVIYVTVTAN